MKEQKKKGFILFKCVFRLLFYLNYLCRVYGWLIIKFIIITVKLPIFGSSIGRVVKIKCF